MRISILVVITYLFFSFSAVAGTLAIFSPPTISALQSVPIYHPETSDPRLKKKIQREHAQDRLERCARKKRDEFKCEENHFKCMVEELRDYGARMPNTVLPRSLIHRRHPDQWNFANATCTTRITHECKMRSYEVCK